MCCEGLRLGGWVKECEGIGVVNVCQEAWMGSEHWMLGGWRGRCGGGAGSVAFGGRGVGSRRCRWWGRRLGGEEMGSKKV